MDPDLLERYIGFSERWYKGEKLIGALATVTGISALDSDLRRGEDMRPLQDTSEKEQKLQARYSFN
jgi:hypothetical protein